MEIIKAEFIKSAVDNAGIENINSLPEFMLCGRSNVGKSSFINALTNQHKLAKTSQNPGKTQTLNVFLLNDSFYLIDVPGYGYARVAKTVKESFGKMIENYLATSENLRLVFLLVDYRHKPTQDDVTMYNYLKYYHIPVCVIATKSDKVKNSERKKNKEAIKAAFNLQKEDKLIITSSEKNLGLNFVKEELEAYLNQEIGE